MGHIRIVEKGMEKNMDNDMEHMGGLVGMVT